MKIITELANGKTINLMTNREKAICILSTLKSNPEKAANLCRDIGISKEIAVQAALDICGLAKEIRECFNHDPE